MKTAQVFDKTFDPAAIASACAALDALQATPDGAPLAFDHKAGAAALQWAGLPRPQKMRGAQAFTRCTW